MPVTPELLIYVAVIQLFQIIPLLIWQYRMINTGQLRTDREMQEKIEENKWLRAKNDELTSQNSLLTMELGTSNIVLKQLRDAAAKKKSP